MLRNLLRYCALVGVIGLGACELEVVNPNSPETDRVLGTPNDAENLLGSYYRRWHAGLYGNTTFNTASYWGMAAGQSFENYSSLANNCQNQRNGIPRAINDNSIGNGCNGEQSRIWNFHHEVNRVASNIRAQFERPGYTLDFNAPFRDERAKSFAQFLRGVSLGYLALSYDSAAVVTPETGPEDAGELLAYPQVMEAALAALDQAIVHANAGNGSGGFPLPGTWIPSPTSFTHTEFIRLIRAYRSRLRANMPRTPSEADALGAAWWQAVTDDALAGFTSDHLNTTSSTQGPFFGWVAQWYSSGIWHQMTPFVIGMGDISGTYDAWIAEPLSNRGSGETFFMQTPDLRFPQGATRSEQQADFTESFCASGGASCKRYFRSKPESQDQNVGLSWGWSSYDHRRWYSWRFFGNTGSAANGDVTFFTKAELNLLAAEGYFRRGMYTEARDLINLSRTRGMEGTPPVARGGGLPALVSINPADPVPGGGECVPRVPVGAVHGGGGTTQCGNMWEALKWEKRIETAYTHYTGWYLDSRRWGDLPEGTPLYLAVPYADMQARGRPASAIYSTGVGQAAGSAAGPSTYGW